MNPFERNSSQIISNVEELRSRKIDPENLEHQEELIHAIQEFVVTDEQFKDHIKSAEFSLHGISSIVTFIETGEGKFVLKVPMSIQSTGAEPAFFQQWEAAGVSVPHVMREGKLAGHPYWIMPFINAETINHTIEDPRELVQAGILRDMGTTLRQMHEPTAEGVGRPVRNESGELAAPFDDFRSWIESEGMRQRIDRVRANGILTDEHGSIDQATSILSDYTETNPRKSFCHWDYSLDNIFGTRPLTVFDPDTMYNCGIMDLGRAMFLNLTSTGLDMDLVKELETGYFGAEGRIDPRVIHSAILYAAYMKMAFWSKMQGSRMKKISRAQKYLSDHKDLLGS